jgi:hypothetical protein
MSVARCFFATCTPFTLISNLKEITFDLVVTAIGIVGCGKIKIQKYPSRE